METKELTTRIDEIVRPVVQDMGYDLILAEWTTDRGHPVVRLYIDRPGEEETVNISDCTQVSREVSSVLDIEDPLPGKRYRLEVSSPGVDRPLVTPEHFRRYKGQEARVRLKKDVAQKRKRYRGLIKEVSEGSLQIDVDGQLHRIELDHIDKANLVGEIP